MPQPPGIFICYRRDDTAGHAGRLYDHLSAHFGEGHVFMDVDQIEPGQDFTRAINEAVASCQTVLVLVGRNWLTSRDGVGRRRLDNPGDYVRLEIVAALGRRVQLIPLLVQGARMPSPQYLPPALSSFCLRHAFELSDLRWNYDVERLIAAIENVRGARRGATRARRASGVRRRFQEWVTVALWTAIALAATGLVAAYFYRPYDTDETPSAPVADASPRASSTPTSSPTPAPSPTPDAAGSKAVEVAFWNSVHEDDEKELQAYLKKYPDGEFKDLANIRLAKLGNTVVFNISGSDPGAVGEERERLDKFAAALREVPTAQGYIVAYGGQRGPRGEAQANADRAKNYLVRRLGIDASRVVTVDGGFRKSAETEFWIVPAGATPPPANPTVDPSDVRSTDLKTTGRTPP